MGSEYWQKRFQAVEDMNNKSAMKTVQSITPSFDKAQAQIEREINAWYTRFAKNNQIDLVEAKKLLNTKELKEFRWDVEEYIKYGRENAVDQLWMKELENASARFHISRLEALKIRTQNAAEVAFGNELDQINEMAARVYMDDYYHTAYEIQRGLGIGWDVAQIDQKKLDKILSKPWTADKMTFKSRAWKSKTQLIDALHTELTQMCVLGKAPDQTISNIAKRFGVAKHQAGRLVMTESAYFGSAAQKDCFNDLDVEEFEVIATLDHKTSEICQQMDGVHKPMKDFEIGVTAPPFHVYCRSCTAPYFEDEDGERAARNEKGETYYVPSSMKYDEWKKTFVDGGSKKGLAPVVDIASDVSETTSKTSPEDIAKQKQKLIDLYGDELTLRDYGSEEHKELFRMLENGEDVDAMRIQAYEQHKKLLDSSIIEHSKKLQNLDHEEAIIFDMNGKILDHKKGTVGAVQFDKATARSYKGQNLTHNHPYNEYGTRLFSVEDIDFADNNGLSSITTIDKDGVVRVLYRDKYFIPEDNDHFLGMLGGKYRHIPTKEKEQWLFENAEEYGWKYTVVKTSS